MMESLVLVLQMRLGMHDGLIEESEGIGKIMGSSSSGSLDETPCAVISRVKRIGKSLSERGR
ncbi:hypothetical protein M407DRAFT_244648, partial [Tulasnella calospora MUT 4182]